MPVDAKTLLASHHIHGYGTADLLRFEKHMEQYFEREFGRWRGNRQAPENYGVSSFEGELFDPPGNATSVDHYNMDHEIYRSFLDSEYLAYSMGYYGFTDASDGPANSLSLEQAQEYKYRLIIERADIRDGQNILDVGCGYGGFIKFLLQNFDNITATGLNPSSTQTGYIRNVLKPDGSRFTLVPKSLEAVTVGSSATPSFDRIISIGVLEHFSNLDRLFASLKRLLKPGGKSLHHLIVSADTIPQLLNAEDTLIAEYFPGGHVWPYSEMTRHTRHLDFVNSWFINGRNYRKTLDEWHKRFWSEIDRLFPLYLSVSEVESWNNFFALSKAMFSADHGRSYGVGHYLYENTSR
jgi:cyclopropane-fatty-acyl-phospholipid synthase